MNDTTARWNYDAPRVMPTRIDRVPSVFLTCKHCGWVHYGVTRLEAARSVAEFNEFYDEASAETQSHYGRRASIETYTHCFRCGELYTNFRIARDEDCPRGCTLHPLIMEGVE